MSTKSYRKQVEVTGSVYQINIESRTFKIKTDDGLRVKAPYTDETKGRVFQAAQDPEQWLIKVSGLGEFAPEGTLKRVVKADHIIMAVARWERGEIDPDAPTFSERADAFIARYPKEFWDSLPTDLVDRHLANHGFYVDDEPVVDNQEN